MENQNGNNSQFQKTNISTNSISMFDTNSNMLKMSFLDESLSIGIWEPVTDPNTGKKSYPQEKRNNFILTEQRASALYALIIQKVAPAVASNSPYNGGVFTSNKKDRVFTFLVQENTVYAYLHSNIDEDRHPHSTIVFEFPKITNIENYNAETGDFDLCEMNSGFYLFTRVIDGFIMHVGHASTHDFRYANRFTTDKVFTYLKEIATKLGCTIPQNTYGNKPSTGFDVAHASATTASDMPDMSPVDDISALLG